MAPRQPTTYVVKAWRDWSDTQPATRGPFDDLAAARLEAAEHPDPLIDLIRHDPELDGRGGGRVIATRRMVAYPGTENTFAPRDDFADGNTE